MKNHEDFNPDIQAALEEADRLAEEIRKEPAKPAKAPAVPIPPKPAPSGTSGGDLLNRILDGEDFSDQITDTMRQAYTRALLGGAPFAHTFPVLGGKVSVTFEEPGAADAAVHGRLSSRIAVTDAEGANALTLLYFLRRVHFDGGDREPLEFSPPKPPEGWEGMPAHELSAALQDLFVPRAEALGGTLVRVIAPLWVMFSGAWRSLVREALPSTF